MTSTERTQRRTGASTSGFTLVEVMVALVVLAVGALALTHLSTSVAVLMQQSSSKTELIALAENRLESVLTRPFSSLAPGTEDDTVSVRGIPYVRTVAITAPNSRSRRITIDLRSPVTDAQRYSVLTYVSAP